MLLSLFTPTHKPQHLTELYSSLLQQKGAVPWEWVIVPNGNCKVKDIPTKIRDDARVRVIQNDSKNIGALKRFACDQCKGDVFVEMDHDDTLCETTFEELAAMYTRVPNGFYYSDFINAKPDGTCETYGLHYGWESYCCTVNGKEYTACRAFEPSARSLCHIHFAPNHIRAWSRAAYTAAGGYDAALKVGDDHDLLCRTYIAGAPFVWIRKPLYIYRRWDKNSFLLFNSAIQKQQAANCDKYLYDLVLSETRRHGRAFVDIGRGLWCRDGFESVDVAAAGFDTSNASLLHGYSDNSVGVVRAHDFLQRVPQDKIVPLMNEVWRVLAPGGWFLTLTPSIDDGKGQVGRGAFQDPTHLSYWSPNNFWYYTDQKYANMISGLKAKFQDVRIGVGYPTPKHEQNKIPYVTADLSAIKGQRQPGLKKF